MKRSQWTKLLLILAVPFVVVIAALIAMYAVYMTSGPNTEVARKGYTREIARASELMSPKAGDNSESTISYAKSSFAARSKSLIKSEVDVPAANECIREWNLRKPTPRSQTDRTTINLDIDRTGTVDGIDVFGGHVRLEAPLWRWAELEMTAQQLNVAELTCVAEIYDGLDASEQLLFESGFEQIDFSTIPLSVAETVFHGPGFGGTMITGCFDFIDNAGQWAVLRAFSRGDHVRAKDYLVRYAALLVRVHRHQMRRMDEPRFQSLALFALQLKEHGWLDDGDLQELQQMLYECRLSATDWEAMHSARALLTAEQIKSDPGTTIPTSGDPGWAEDVITTILRPAYSKSIERLVVAELAGKEEVYAREYKTKDMLLKLMGREEIQWPWFRHPDPQMLEQFPYLDFHLNWLNDDMKLAEFILAAERYRGARGRWPENTAEMTPEFLPLDFDQPKTADWYVRVIPSFNYPASLPILQPNDGNAFQDGSVPVPQGREELVAIKGLNSAGGDVEFREFASRPTFIRAEPISSINIYNPDKTITEEQYAAMAREGPPTARLYFFALVNSRMMEQQREFLMLDPRGKQPRAK